MPTKTTTYARNAGMASPGVGSVAIEVNNVKSQTIYTIDDLLFNRSQTIPDVPLIAYPATSRGRADYVRYTAKDLDRFANHGAMKYTSMGLVRTVRVRYHI